MAVTDDPLMDAISSSSIRILREFDPQAIGSTAWAFAKLAFKDLPLFHSLAAEALRKISECKPQELANIAWALATIGLTVHPLMSAISAASLTLISEFGEQELANMAWAFATLLIKDEPLLDSIAAAAISKISHFSSQNIANMAWSFATLMKLHDPLFEATASSALRTISHFDAQDLANTAWACATLGFENEPLMSAISAASIRKMTEFHTQNLSNTAWAFATLGFLDDELMNAISKEVIKQVEHFRSMRGTAIDPGSFAMDVGGVVWAFNFAEVLDPAFARLVRDVVLEIGRGMDERCRWTPTMGDGRVPQGFVAVGVPHAELDLLDRLAILKPPGWEVDTTDVGNAKHLSQYLQSVLSCPLAFDVSHSYGFLHRLDTPSSGLILTAKTYEAFYDLKHQLSIGDLVRDYIVLCRGLVDPQTKEIHARVYHWRHEGNLPSTVCRKGKPSVTRLKVLAHCGRQGEDFSLVAVRIRTGRRHQIRAHTTHIGHPTVCDGKYTDASTFLRDKEWCERNFLHRYRLAFIDKVGQFQEAFAPLPGDLVQALRCLSPHTASSAAALDGWIGGAAHRDWAEYSVLGDA